MSYYYARCHACGAEWDTPVSEGTFSLHEHRYHGDAHTVWTWAQERYHA